jgi:hypothetical protein
MSYFDMDISNTSFAIFTSGPTVNSSKYNTDSPFTDWVLTQCSARQLLSLITIRYFCQLMITRYIVIYTLFQILNIAHYQINFEGIQSTSRGCGPVSPGVTQSLGSPQDLGHLLHV